MNSYKIKSIDSTYVVVDYTIGKTVETERYDARYLPLEDAIALDEYMQVQLAGKTKDAEVVAIPDEVTALVGKKVDLVLPEVVDVVTE